MTDIAGQVRQLCSCWNPMFPDTEPRCETCLAADEIERLRKALPIGDELARFTASAVVCSCRRNWVCLRCTTLSAWEGVRGG